jgi:hypothetical protein
MSKLNKKHLTGSKLRDYNFTHTQQRARQRYNLVINRSNYEQLCMEIKQKKFIQLRSSYKKRHQEIYKIKFKNTTMYVLYKEEGNRITTMLPFQRFERLQKEVA